MHDGHGEKVFDLFLRTARLHRGGHRRRGAIDRRVRVPPAPAGRTHPRRLPHRLPCHRRARQGQDRGQEVRHARKGVRDPIKGARWALLKNESDLNAAQRARLECVANTNEALWTAYKLKERLGMILRQDADAAAPLLRQWAADASLCGIAEFSKLGEKIARRHFDIR
nr:transposase [Bifidobacterium pseudocatenulatum]